MVQIEDREKQLLLNMLENLIQELHKRAGRKGGVGRDSNLHRQGYRYCIADLEQMIKREMSKQGAPAK